MFIPGYLYKNKLLLMLWIILESFQLRSMAILEPKEGVWWVKKIENWNYPEMLKSQIWFWEKSNLE